MRRASLVAVHLRSGALFAQQTKQLYELVVCNNVFVRLFSFVSRVSSSFIFVFFFVRRTSSSSSYSDVNLEGDVYWGPWGVSLEVEGRCWQENDCVLGVKPIPLLPLWSRVPAFPRYLWLRKRCFVNSSTNGKKKRYAAILHKLRLLASEG